MDTKELLRRVADGAISVDEAAAHLSAGREHDLGFARVDLDRHRRCCVPEVIFGSGKTPEQIAAIMQAFVQAGHNVLATRIAPGVFETVRAAHPSAQYHADARCLTLDVAPLPRPAGQVAIVTAGTSDLPVAEEAALAAERMGAGVVRIYDAGVAGLHRLVRHLDTLRASRALVVVAGMEGALPSVVGGLIDRPIVAVPTSVGYGTSLQGLAALLAMLNSCVPGITVVNVDNGFGAGVAAALINRAGEAP